MSTILKAYANIKYSSWWLWSIGCICIPCCCAGTACLLLAEEISKFKILFPKVIEIYGGKKNCKILGERIRTELNIFCKALTIINSSCSPIIIKTNTTLLEVICHVFPNTGNIITDVSKTGIAFLDQKTEKHNEYFNKLWETYTALGGNYQIVVYGIIEYLCQTNEPTSDYVEQYLQEFTSYSALRAECLSYKK